MNPHLFGQPNTLAYWDPANLLQVAWSNGNPDDAKFQCVGRARYNLRCKWVISEPSLSKIPLLLREMSETKPESVTEKTLRRLASLCLCQDYHSSQKDTIARHWLTVVETAVQYNKNLIKSVGSNPYAWEERFPNSAQTKNKVSAQIPSIPQQHQECQDTNMSEVRASMEKLYQVLDARDKKLTTLVKAEPQTATPSDRIDKAEREVADYRARIYVLEEEKRCDKTKDHLRDCLSRRDQLEEENERLRANADKLALLQDSLAACQAKKDQLERVNETRAIHLESVEKTGETLAADLEELRVQASAFRECGQQLAAEASATTSSLKQCRVDLIKERDRNTALNERITSLELSQSELMESILGCWLHRFWAWVSRQRGTSNASASRLVLQETILQANKV